MKKKLLIIVAGPTAVGKTNVSIQLANHFNCPVLSFDSRQFFKEMSIGTAKPNPLELNQAKHYFINSHSIHDGYTCGQFETESIDALNGIFKDNDYCVAVGGSGLYINSLCYGIDEIPTDQEIKNKLIHRWQNEGLEILQKELLAVDPEFYHSADIKNPRRVIRALEVHAVSAKPYSFFRKNQAKTREFETIWLGLNLPKEILMDRIHNRVDEMIQQGLIKEVTKLSEFQDLKALNTVGYQELFSFINGEMSLEKSIELIKRNTRHFAKKQVVWFKKNSEIQWFEPSQTSEMISKINQKYLQINL